MRIAIVNDVALAREALNRVVLSRPGFAVAWVAEDGAQAVRMAAADRPDAILMDLIMPGMDGVEATRRIMAASPCPVLVVTSTVTGNYAMVVQAMSYGGLDAVQTPELGLCGVMRGGQDLLDRLERIDRARRRTPAELALPAARTALVTGAAPPLVALGASTGGPEALAVILERLPANFAAPIVVVQHILAEYAPGLVTVLRSRSRLPVEAAREGASPIPGTVAVAITDDHLVLTKDLKFHYRREPVERPFRPSVDELFASLAQCWPTPGVAVLLTGMWDDGARGLGQLRHGGWLTIAQDEATSVVYGMPRAAVERNAASRVLPIGEIAGAIAARLSCSRTPG